MTAAVADRWTVVGVVDTRSYAAPPAPLTMKVATAVAARHFRTEAVQVNPAAVADSAHTVVAFRVDGWDPRGWAILGPSIVVTVTDDGEATIESDE